MMGLSCKFKGYGKFFSCKNITKCSLFKVENPCLCSFYLRGEASLRAGLETASLHFLFFRKVQKFLGAEDAVLSTSTVTKFSGAEDQMFLCPRK